MYKHVFGPVPSRRLGVSLGVDLVKPKSCNMNCVFCECGATPKLSTKRESFKDIKEVEKELKSVLKDVTPDYITFSGSGEPTLSKDLGKIVKWIKNNTDVKVCLITNGLLLKEDEVIEEISDVDLIIPTLNSVNNEVFHKINRPDKNVDISMVMEGLRKLSASCYKGKIYLETFIIEGLTDRKEDIEKMAKFLQKIRFDKLQLNSLARRGAESWVKPASIECLKNVEKIFHENGIKNVEIIKEMKEIEKKLDIKKDLLENMKAKREYSEEEIEKIFKK